MTLREDIHRRVGERLNISPQEAKIAEIQFEFLRTILNQGSLIPVRLPYFGTFYVKPYRLKRIHDRRDEQKIDDKTSTDD